MGQKVGAKRGTLGTKGTKAREDGHERHGPRDTLVLDPKRPKGMNEHTFPVASHTDGYPPCKRRRRQVSKLTRPSNKCIDRPIRLAPDLGSRSFKVRIEIASIL